jgi:hypothetical protein
MTTDKIGVEFYKRQLKKYIQEIGVENPAILWQMIEAYVWSYHCDQWINNNQPYLKQRLKDSIDEILDAS